MLKTPLPASIVIPADAGIHDTEFLRSRDRWVPWIPTFVGRTEGKKH